MLGVTVMMFQPDLETLPREELEKLQLTRIQNLVSRVYANVPFYRKKFDEIGLKPEHIKTLNDVKLLPFTEKQDLRNNYPFGMFAVPREHIVRLHSSSGTTGKATVVGYTKRDLDNWADMVARCLAMAGVTPNDVLHNAYGYGLFTGGLGMHDGCERLGATVIPMSGGATKRQIQVLKDFGSTAICCTPSYGQYLYEAMQDAGLTKDDFKLRIGVFGAEPWTEAMRRDMEGKLGIKAMDIYGLSEIMGPGVAMECHDAQDGMHVMEDHFYIEIIDPITGEVLPHGEVGELVITTITKEGIPLIRYRTRDLTIIDDTPCKCSRTFHKVKRFKGRSDDMLIIRGVNVYPQQIESILMEAEGTSANYQIIVSREGTMDNIEVQVEVDEANFSDEVRKLQKIESSIQRTIKEFLGVTAKVRLVDPRTITRSEGKAVRVIDNRPKGE